MNRKLYTGVFAAALVLMVGLYASPAQAISFQTNAYTSITSINNVLIQGLYYEVTFADPAPTTDTAFPGLDTPDAYNATDASQLLSALNSTATSYFGYYGVQTTPAATEPYLSFYIINLATDTYYVYQGSFIAPYQQYSWTLTPSNISGGISPSWQPLGSTPTPYAIFSEQTVPESPVPEPSTAALFLVGMGLICLIGLRRKSNGQIHST